MSGASKMDVPSKGRKTTRLFLSPVAEGEGEEEEEEA